MSVLMPCHARLSNANTRKIPKGQMPIWPCPKNSKGANARLPVPQKMVPISITNMDVVSTI